MLKAFVPKAVMFDLFTASCMGFIMMVRRFDFGGLVFSVTNDFQRLQRNICKRANLYSGQPRVLTILMHSDGLSLKELSEACRIGMSSLSVSVRNLQKSGLIRKEGKRKNQKIFLTETGLERAQAFHVEIDEFYRSLLEHFGSDADTLNDILTRLDDYIKNYNQRYSESDEEV